MNYLNYIIFILAYLLGSIPFGLILSKCFLGLDIRTIGSGNIGATNVYRTGNKLIAIATLILDCFKGFLAILLAKQMNLQETQIIMCGCLSIIGHIYPFWLKFKGGKGVATAIAVVITITPLIGLVVMMIWLIMFICKKISSLASIVATIFLPLLAAIFDYSSSIVAAYLIISILILIKHIDNIKRLFCGEEKKI